MTPKATLYIHATIFWFYYRNNILTNFSFLACQKPDSILVRNFLDFNLLCIQLACFFILYLFSVAFQLIFAVLKFAGTEKICSTFIIACVCRMNIGSAAALLITSFGATQDNKSSVDRCVYNNAFTTLNRNCVYETRNTRNKRNKRTLLRGAMTRNHTRIFTNRHTHSRSLLVLVQVQADECVCITSILIYSSTDACVGRWVGCIGLVSAVS